MDATPVNEANDSLAMQAALGSSSWASRNPSKTIITPRVQGNRATGARKATNDEKRRQKKEAAEALEQHLADYKEKEEVFIAEAAKHFGKTEDYIKGLLHNHSGLKNSRAVSWANAMLHYKAIEVNAERGEGNKVKLAELQQLVARDHELQSSSPARRAELIAALQAHRETQQKGARANNTAAAVDFRATMKLINREITHLSERIGAYAFTFATRSHIHDEYHSSWVTGSNNAVDFLTEVMNITPADFAQKFELWAIAREKGPSQTETLTSLRMDVTKLISNGLCAVLNTAGVAMSYIKYETDIVQKLGVKLVGWPVGVPFASPSTIGTVGDVRMIREALKCGECRWVALSHREKEEHAAKMNAAAREQGPNVKKRKQRSDKGKKRKRKGATPATDVIPEEQAPAVASSPAKRRKKATSNAIVVRSLPPMQFQSREIIEDSDEYSDDD